MITEQEVRDIMQDINIIYLELIDDSLYHRGHVGNVNNGGHYQLILVSDDFQDVPKLQRHRLVYDKFSNALRNKIHALGLKIMTTTEWEKYQAKE